MLLHHGAILCNVDGAAEVLAGDFGWGDERFLSFLPLSHALEHTAGLYLPIGLGAEIWFAEGLDKLASNIEEAQPTFMVVVPRLFELLRGRIIKQVEKQGRLANFLLDQALALAERRAAGVRRLTDWPVEKLLELTLRPKIRARFGGRIKALVSGGAPLNPEVGAFFESMGLVMLQGYGQTESAPVVSCNYPSAGIKLDTVGPPLRGRRGAGSPRTARSSCAASWSCSATGSNEAETAQDDRRRLAPHRRHRPPRRARAGS